MGNNVVYMGETGGVMLGHERILRFTCCQSVHCQMVLVSEVSVGPWHLVAGCSFWLQGCGPNRLL